MINRLGPKEGEIDGIRTKDGGLTLNGAGWGALSQSENQKGGKDGQEC